MPSLQYYIRRVRELPFSVVLKLGADLVGQKLRAIVQKASVRVIGTELKNKTFLRTVWSRPHRFKDARSLRSFFRNRTSLALFVNQANREAVKSLLVNNFPKAADSLIAKADKTCDHVFDLLGSGEANLGERIDWHRDFKTGYQWDPSAYYRDINIPYGKADIKVPWELSRFSHAVTLGQAYWLTGNEKYTREFMAQVSSWIDGNKPKFGVNWACTMDVAIRACNWIAGYSFFKDSPAITDEFFLKFLKSLYQHGGHVRDNLEYSETLTSNHYLSNVVGLVYLGVMFPEFKEAAAWKEFGVRELALEMEKQVYADGCDFEASTCYHRLVLELFFFATLTVVVNNEGFSGDNFTDISRKVFGGAYTDRLRKMFEAILYLLKPNGKMPQLGDNDSGRLHVFSEREVLDMRYLLTLGAVFFNDPKFKVREFGFCEEALWVFGERGHRVWRDMPECALADLSSVAFQAAGWYIMRNDRDYMIVSCGPNGQKGNGGHSHNDKLGFELCLDGRDMVIDPGTYLYTPEPEMRNLFRSTGFHSTVIIDGTEQNETTKGNSFLFLLPDDARSKTITWETGDTDVFLGEHHGYQRLPQPVVHRREIRFFKLRREWEIVDRFLGSGEHTLEWNFILSPYLRQELRITSESVPLREEKALYSAEYGARVETGKLRGTVRATVPFEAKFLLHAVGPDAGTLPGNVEGVI